MCPIKKSRFYLLLLITTKQQYLNSESTSTPAEVFKNFRNLILLTKSYFLLMCDVLGAGVQAGWRSGNGERELSEKSSCLREQREQNHLSGNDTLCLDFPYCVREKAGVIKILWERENSCRIPSSGV